MRRRMHRQPANPEPKVRSDPANAHPIPLDVDFAMFASLTASVFSNDMIRKSSDSFDLHLAHVARLHEELRVSRDSDATWSPGNDDVARLQCHRLADDRHQRGHV